MDPQAALHELLVELTNSQPDRERIEELLEALHGWVKRGGFLPTVEPKGDYSSDLFHVAPSN